MARYSFRSISAPFPSSGHREVRGLANLCAVSVFPGALVAMAKCWFRSILAPFRSGGHGEVQASVHICTTSAFPGAMVARCSFRSTSAPFRSGGHGESGGVGFGAFLRHFGVSGHSGGHSWVLASVHVGAVSHWVRVSDHFYAISACPGALVALARWSFRSIPVPFRSGGHREVRGI